MEEIIIKKSPLKTTLNIGLLPLSISCGLGYFVHPLLGILGALISIPFIRNIYRTTKSFEQILKLTPTYIELVTKRIPLKNIEYCQFVSYKSIGDGSHEYHFKIVLIDTQAEEKVPLSDLNLERSKVEGLIKDYLKKYNVKELKEVHGIGF